MIVDTSALLAILFAEPEAPTFQAAIAAAPEARMSAISYVEASLRVETIGVPEVVDLFDRLCRELGLILVPVSIHQAELARIAFRTYGKGRNPQARLNFGDCFAYALAKETGEPLLFKGDDFSATDIPAALAPTPPPSPPATGAGS